MRKYLSHLEIFICFSIASLTFLKSMHSTYLEGQSNSPSIKAIPATLPWLNDFKNFDFAWESTTTYVKTNFITYIIYIIVMEVTRAQKHLQPEISSCIFGISFISNYFGILVANVMVINCIAIFFITKYTKWDQIIWLWAIIMMFVLRLPTTFTILVSYMGDDDHKRGVNLLMMLSWNVLRSVSFSIEYINQHKSEHRMGLSEMFSYIFYFPTMVTGPIINFSEFKMRHLPVRRTRYLKLMVEVIRCVCVFSLIEGLQHVFFVADPIYFPKVRC